MKDQAVAIENTLFKNVSNLEETVSAHTILVGTLNVKEDLKENSSDIPKNNIPENVNGFLTDHIDAVDRNITDDNSIPNNIPGSIPHKGQLIDFVVSDNIANNNTRLIIMTRCLIRETSTDIDDILTQVREKNNIFPAHQRNIQRHH